MSNEDHSPSLINTKYNPSTNRAATFVTGGSGMLGSHLVQHLVAKNIPVKALYRSSVPIYAGSEKVDWIQGDILDILLLEEAMVDVSTVYHCAAMVSFNPAKRNLLFKTNVDGTTNVVNAALQAGVHKLCYVSSVAALGSSAGTVIDETNVWNTADVKSSYAHSKYLAEMEVWRGIGEGLQSVIVNPSIILGAGNWEQGSSKIFQTVYKEFPWFTEGVTGFVDVDDVVKAMTELTHSTITNERFILSAENRTYKDLFSTIAKSFGKKPPHKKVTPFIANLVRMVEGFKHLFSNEEPLLTKETAEAAQMIINYRNEKLISFLPAFTYTKIDTTIERVCSELKKHYNLT